MLADITPEWISTPCSFTAGVHIFVAYCYCTSWWVIPIINQQNCKNGVAPQFLLFLSLRIPQMGVSIQKVLVNFMGDHHFSKYFMVIELCSLIWRKTHHSYCWLCMPLYSISSTFLPLSQYHPMICRRNNHFQPLSWELFQLTSNTNPSTPSQYPLPSPPQKIPI